MLNQQKIYCLEYLKSLVSRFESSGDSLLSSFKDESVTFYLPWMREFSNFYYQRVGDGKIEFKDPDAVFAMFDQYPQWHQLLVTVEQLWKNGKSPTTENLHVILHEVPFLLSYPWLVHAMDVLSKDPVFCLVAQQMEHLDDVQCKAYFKGFIRHMKSATSNRLSTQVIAMDYVTDRIYQKDRQPIVFANQSCLVARFPSEGKPVFFIYRIQNSVVEMVAQSTMGVGDSLNPPEMPQHVFSEGLLLDTAQMCPMNELLWCYWMEQDTSKLSPDRGVERYHRMMRSITPNLYVEQLNWLDSLLSIKSPQWASQVISGLSKQLSVEMDEEAMLQFTA